MRLSRFVLAGLAFVLLALPSAAQAPCAPTVGAAAASLPQYSGTVNGVLATPPGGGQYLYVLTQYGIARGSLTDPSKPGPFVLAQIGHKSTAGVDNGGKVPMVCDCWQGGKTIAAAEAADGSARMISDWNGRGGGSYAEVATADSKNNVAFGQQINSGSVPLGSRVAALYLPSGKYVGYFPFQSAAQQGGVVLVDLTATSGNPDAAAALLPFSTLAWGSGSAVTLEAARIGSQYLLAGAVPIPGTSQMSIQIADVDASTGVPTPRSSIGTAGSVFSISVASVNGRTFVFSAEGSSGLQVYEYAAGALSRAGSIPGSIDQVVVRGSGPFPLIFAHTNSGWDQYVDIYDTNWVTQGGLPRQAAHLPHYLIAPQPGFKSFIGRGIEAAVSGNIAYLYRIQPGVGQTDESVVVTTALDVSCIAIDPSSPPIANLTMSNLSAAGRADQKNYFGDRWKMQDASATAPSKPLNEIDWDLNVPSPYTASQFVKDPAPWSATSPSPLPSTLNNIIWPCDPSAAGDPNSGAGCYASINPAQGSFSLGIHTANANPASPSVPSTFVAPGTAVSAPQAYVNGQTGTGVQLNVLSGGTADAGGSQGNIAEAQFAWTFNPGAVAATGQKVGVPANATSFTLDAAYKGGYSAPRVSGTVSVVDLVPDFSPASASVIKGGSLLLTNQMQKSALATLNTVDYSWDGGTTFINFAACPGGPNCSFLSMSGQGTVTAPSVLGPYNLMLRYNFTNSSGRAQSLTVSHGPFNVTNNLIVTFVNPPTSGLAGVPVTFTASAAGGSGSTTYSWCWETCNLFPVFTAGPATNSHTYSAAGTNLVIVRATDSGVTASASTTIVISGSGGGGVLSAYLSGPASGPSNAPVTFTAVASGGTGSYSYAWRWGDNALAPYVAGPATNSYTYGAPGVYTLTVRVTDTASNTTSTSAGITIIQSGPPAPNPSFAVNGATSNPLNGTLSAEARAPLTFISGETRAASWSWNFGDGATASGPTVTHSFQLPGSYTVTLTLTGDGTNTVGASTGSRRITINAPKFSALVVPDAAGAATSDGSWKTDITVGNPGTVALTITPVYVPYTTILAQPTPAIDVTTLGFSGSPAPKSYSVPAGGAWSQTDVVGFLGGTGKGNLIVKFDGGPVPTATARVSFIPSDPAKGGYGSALPVLMIGAYGQIGTAQEAQASLPQTIVGLRSDAESRFSLKLYNSSGMPGYFKLTAYGQDGGPVSLKGESGSAVYAISPYFDFEKKDTDLGLTDPSKRYVLKAEPLSTATTLFASAAVIDRQTNDQVEVRDGGPGPAPDALNNVVTYLPGVSRIDSGGARWRTSVTIFNSGSSPRGVLVEYLYSVGGRGPNKLAQNFFIVRPNSMLTDGGLLLDFSDVSKLFPNVADLTADAGTAGVLRITHPADGDSKTNPVFVSGRNYDDRSGSGGGTAGTRISTYSAADAIVPGDPAIVIPGAEEDDRFRTNVGAFALDDALTVVRVTAVDPNGSPIGSPVDLALNQDGVSGHWMQFRMDAIAGLPAQPVSLRFQVLQGGRAGVYAVNVDKKSLDLTFLKGRRQD